MTPINQTVSGRRLHSLTGLRALAAFAVFLDHAQYLLAGRPRTALHYVGAQGAMGVTFFFCLSGFVLAWSNTVQKPVSFYWARFARIYPVYLVALTGGLIVTIAAGTYSSVAQKFAVTAILVQAWSPSYDWSFAINGVSWSLSCEAFFYLCFPLLLTVMRDLSARVRYTALVGTVVWAFTNGFIGNAFGGAAGTWFSDTMPISRLAAFIAGVVLALEVKVGRFPHVNRFAALVFAIATYAVGGLWLTRWTNAALPLVPFALLIVAYAQRDVAGGGTVFARRASVWLGEISFCFYLVHQLVIRVATPLGPTSSFPTALALGSACLTTSVFAAWLLHRLVELPANTFLRRHSPRIDRWNRTSADAPSR